ncbi:MAG: GNAT family N-acetyltransferase [Gemmatimonadaceae bacterium]
MISGRWGKPSRVLLDLSVGDDGTVRGVANPGSLDAPITGGHFDAASGRVELEGVHTAPDGVAMRFHIAGRLDDRTLRLHYVFGDRTGDIDVVRADEYVPPPVRITDRVRRRLARVQRWLNKHTRPRAGVNARRLRERGESLDGVTVRDAVAADIPALAELHVTTWNATYNTTRGPGIETRTWQWNQVFDKQERRDFVLVLEDRNGRLIGFTWGKPHEGEFAGELSKIYLRWEYHGLGLGRRMMAETARRFQERGIESFLLFSELSNPTVGFYDRLGGERLLDDRGQFDASFGWRDLRLLLE